MKRRNIELALLCIAAPLVILLFAMIALEEGDAVRIENLAVPIGLFASFIISHLFVRKFAPAADPALLPLTFALSGIGIAFVTRLAPELAMRQLIFLVVGVLFMILAVIFLRNIERVGKYKYTLMLLGILLLLSPLIPGIGTEINGSRIWLKFGQFSFQPGELAKLLIVLFLGAYLADHREMLSVFTNKVGPFHFPDARALVPLLVMWVISLLIIAFEKDLGSALVVFFVFIVMLYAATGKKSYLVLGLALMALGAVAAYFMYGHVQTRVSIWLDPFADAQDKGFQLVQSIYSMADGGLFGVGIGNGLAQNIPVVESDFIFVAIAEEAGLLGAAGVLLLYLCFAIRGLLTAARAKSDVASFVAVGLTSTIILQAFIIVGGVTRLIPLTGITLPFISQGGSSLLASLIAVGMLLRCGDEGTGLETEMTSGTGLLKTEGVLGRLSLGKRITHIMVVFAVLFALLVANLTMIMVVQARDYQNMPGNNHTMVHQANMERGTISTYDNVVLARSVLQEDGTYKREYPAGTLAAHVVGYASERYGTAGIENTQNEVLQGTQSYASWMDVINEAVGRNKAGNDVKLTINSELQKEAQQALRGFKGACIIMDPETGAVLALASSPTYNAGEFETLLSEDANSDALYNRATQALYPPGSTFKIVSLTTALENNVAKESTTFNSPGEMDIGNAKVRNAGGRGYGTVSLARATEVSSNTVFGQLGVKMGAETVVAGAEKFGFNRKTDFDLPLAESLMPDPAEMTEWELAWAAAGMPVGEHESPAGPQATVLQMAMAGCAIANDGVIQKPYVVESIYNSEGEVSYTAEPSALYTATTPEVAKRVRAVLEGVVENGTGRAAQISGVTIAGKTGTAETGKKHADSWFVGIGPSEDAKVVVALVLEEGADLDGAAAGRAKDVMEAALKAQGQL